MSNNTVSAQISEKFIELQYAGNNGQQKSKVVSFDQLKSILLEELSLDTPLLPSQWGTIQYSRNGNKEQFVITMKEHKRTVHFYDGDNSDEDEAYEDSREYHIVVPNSVWIVNTRKDSSGNRELLHTLGYAIKNPIFSLDNVELYRLPFSNIDDSYACWSGQQPQLPTSYSVSNVPNRFFDSLFNYDLSGGKVRSFHDEEKDINVDNLFEFWNYMQRQLAKDENYRFEYDKLVRVDYSLDSRMRSMKSEYLR